MEKKERRPIEIGGVLTDTRGLEFKDYGKRPVVIKAVRINNAFTVQTLEGKMSGKKGDWLVIGIKGEAYPVDHDIFLKTYEEVS